MTSANSARQDQAPSDAGPNPERLWFTINAYQRTEALRAAIELDLFTAVSRGAYTPESIAAACQASPRGVRILCDFLTVVGFLEKRAGQYHLSPDSAAFLDRSSPRYLGSIVRFLNSPEVMSGFENLADVVRKGGSLLPGGGIADPENPIWIEFARSMAPLIAPAAEFIGELSVQGAGASLRVLELAAGHGLGGIAVARRHPAAQIVANDGANVLAVARENAAAAGVQDRLSLLPGDAFEVEFGKGFDVVLMPNLLHHFDVPTCERLLRKVQACLNPGGRALTLEFVPNADRVSSPIAATFSLMMLGATSAGDAYTLEEYDRMFRNSGFARNEIVPVPRSSQQVIISYR